MANEQITILNGALLGKTRFSCDGKKYYSFEGIPYAKPPIGKLRFRDPQDPEPWTNVRDATTPGNMCAQINPYLQIIEGSEDCLYLNVYTPSLPRTKNEKLPVIFLVHGGGLLYGYSHYYQPDYFVRHNVILVTVNYRLHVLGFLCLNTPAVPGNAGAKDTVMALKWVKNNIIYFNGDSNNVTAFGESAGAGLVTGYVTSKMTEGLFHKVIAGSGNCILEVWIDEDDPVEKAKKMAHDLYEVDDKDVIYDYLLKANVNDLLWSVKKLNLNREPGTLIPYFSVVVEKKHDGVKCFFEEHPRVVLQDNRFIHVPILKGISSHEAAFFINEINGKINFIQNLQVFVPKVLCIKRNTPESSAIVKKLHEYYFGGKAINEELLLKYINLLSDFYIINDTITFVELCTRNMKENLYLYRFAYHGSLNSSIIKKIGLGASHTDILQYQFYGKLNLQKCTQRDLQVVDFLSEAWCNFARFGKPTWANQKTEWLPYTPDNKRCLNIADEIAMDTEMTWNNNEFWKNITREE